MNNQRDNKQFSHIVLLEILVIIAALVFGIWRPFKKAKNLNRLLAQKSVQLSQVKDKEQKLSRLRQELAKKKAGIELLDIAVPEDQETAQALMILEAIAARSGVELTELNPSQDSEGDITIKVSFKSDFSQLKEMFKLMYQDLRPVKIETIKTLAAIDSEGAEEDSRFLTTALEVYMPYVKQNTDTITAQVTKTGEGL